MKALVAALVFALCTPAIAHADTTCEEFTTPGGMHAELCDPGSDTAIVMVPGATYTSVYWDFRTGQRCTRSSGRWRDPGSPR